MKLIMENWRSFVAQEANNIYDESKYGAPIESIDEFEEHMKNLNNLLMEGFEKKYFIITELDDAAADEVDSTEKQSWLDKIKGYLSRGLNFLGRFKDMSADAMNKVLSMLADSVAEVMKRLPGSPLKTMRGDMKDMIDALTPLLYKGLQGLADDMKQEKKAFKAAAQEAGVWPSDEEYIARVKEDDQAAQKWFWTTYEPKLRKFAEQWMKSQHAARAAEAASAAASVVVKFAERTWDDWEEGRSDTKKRAKQARITRLLEIGTGGFVFGAFDNGGMDFVSKVFIQDDYRNMLTDAGWEMQAAIDSNGNFLNTDSDVIGGLLAAMVATWIIRKIAKALGIPGYAEMSAKEGSILETTKWITLGCVVVWAWVTLYGAPWAMWMASAGIMEEEESAVI